MSTPPASDDQTPDAPPAPPPRSTPMRLALGAVALTLGAFWLGARLGPATFLGSTGGLTQGTWLPVVTNSQVYVGGEVAHPGIYPLLSNATVGALVSDAGGPTRYADTKRLDLNAVALSGQTVMVPRRGSTCATP